jgi:Trk-type K+ transport system membrane component
MNPISGLDLFLAFFYLISSFIIWGGIVYALILDASNDRPNKPKYRDTTWKQEFYAFIFVVIACCVLYFLAKTLSVTELHWYDGFVYKRN